jgi:hypothetical protein
MQSNNRRLNTRQYAALGVGVGDALAERASDVASEALFQLARTVGASNPTDNRNILLTQ